MATPSAGTPWPGARVGSTSEFSLFFRVSRATNMTYAKRCRLCGTVPVTGRGPRYFRQPRAVWACRVNQAQTGRRKGKANDTIGAGCPQVGGSHGSAGQQRGPSGARFGG